MAGEDSDTADTDGRLSSESSPLPQRRGGILKGGRLWKSMDTEKDINEQVNIHVYYYSNKEQKQAYPCIKICSVTFKGNNSARHTKLIIKLPGSLNCLPVANN